MSAETILVRLKTIGQARFRRDMQGAGKDVEGLGRSQKLAAWASLHLERGSRRAASGVRALMIVAAAAAGAQGIGLLITAAQSGAIALVALGSAGGAALGVLGVFALGAAARFKQMADQGGSAANLLKTRFGEFKKLLSDELGPAFAPVFTALARALGPIGNLVRQLAPTFRTLGFAVGKAAEMFATRLAGMGPELNQLLRGVARLVPPLATALFQLFRVFILLANAGMPYLIRGTRWLAGALRDLGDNVKGGAAAGAFHTFGATIKTLGGIIRAIAPVFAAIMKRAGELGTQLIDALKPALPFWENVLWPLIKGIGQGIGDTLEVTIKVIGFFARVLGSIGQKARPLRGVFQGIGRFIGTFIAGPLMKALSVLPKVGRLFGAIGRIVGGVGGAFSRLLGIVGRVVGGGVRLFVRFHVTVVRTVTRMIGAVVRPFASLGGKLLGPLRGAFSRVWSFLRSAGSTAFNLGRKVVSKLVDGVKGIGKAIIGAFRGGIGFAGDVGRAIADWLNDHTPLGDKVSLPGPLPDFTLPKLATGGHILRGGLAIVGERGPEVVTLPRGSSVLPNHHAVTQAATTRGLSKASAGRRSAAPAPSPGGGARQPIVVQLVLKSRVVAEAVADVLLDAEAGIA